MNKRQAKKRKQRELWINWCGERFKLPLLMKWRNAKKLKSIDRNTRGIKHE